MKDPTIQYYQSLSRAYILPEEAAKLLGCTPQSVRTAARLRPELLGFPVNIMGNRVRIPRVPFLAFLFGKEAST